MATWERENSAATVRRDLEYQPPRHNMLAFLAIRARCTRLQRQLDLARRRVASERADK